MCFTVDVDKTHKIRAGTDWIRCNKFLIRSTGTYKGWWFGSWMQPAVPWKYNSMHACKTNTDAYNRVTGRRILKIEPEKFPYMRDARGIYAYMGKYHGREIKHLRGKMYRHVPAWIHPKDVLAVADGHDSIKATRIWLGDKPPTKKQQALNPRVI